MNCIYIRKRSKNYKAYFYCTKYKKEIQLNDCKNCIDKEYKKRKPVKQVGKKRVIVSDNTYNQVSDRCNGRCALCYTSNNLHYHHILYRSERKDLIDVPNNGIMLCIKCHKKAHSNKKKYQPILIDIVATQLSDC